MVRESIKRVLTYRSGRFTFSSRFSGDMVNQSLIEAMAIYRGIMDLPILSWELEALNAELFRRSLFASAAIKGNLLSEEMAGRLISSGRTEARGEEAEKEIRNLKDAYEHVQSIECRGQALELTEEVLCALHHLLTKDIRHKDNTPGRYRTSEAKVGDEAHGGVYTPPKNIDDVKLLMNEFILWINGKELIETPPALRGALVHYYLCLIHPFGQGNGRCARLVEAMLLKQAGIKHLPLLLADFYYRNMDGYLRAFSDSIKREDDVAPFLEFTMKGWLDSLNYLRGRIVFSLRRLALCEYFGRLLEGKRINRRQYDLLTMLLDHTGSFTLQDLFRLSPFKILYNGVSERTGRRDLERLLSMKLLNAPEIGRCGLNRGAV